MRYRHLRRTVIAVLATIAFLLIFGLLVRAVLEAEPTRRLAQKWLEETAADLGAELEIGELHWGFLPPGLRLRQVRFNGAGINAEVDALQIDLGKLWLTERTVELGRVAASGVRLSLTGLPEAKGGRRDPIKVRVRHLALEDVEFEGVDLPGKINLDLKGVRSSWSTESEESRGFAEVSQARLRIGAMEPLDFSLVTRFVLNEDRVDISNYRLEGVGFALQGRGRVGGGSTRLEVRGPIDVGWLDGFIRTRGLLDGTANISAVIDSRAEALIQTDIRAPHIEVSGFPLDDLEGSLALVGRTLRGTLDRGRFHGGTIRGRYELGEFGGRYPHTVHLEGEGIALQGFLDNLRVESAGLAATIDLNADSRWNGRSFPSGNGTGVLTFRESTPGLPVSGLVDVALTGEGFLLLDAEELAIGQSTARWQGALTLGTWRPSWSITAEPAVFSEIGPMVNAWVGSTVLPDSLSGTGQLQVDLSGPFSELTVNARVDAAPIILDPIQFDRLVADMTIGGSMLRLGSARFQIADGFGEVAGDLGWGPEGGDDQIDLELRGRRIPLEAVASWVGLEQWVDGGTLTFSGALDGPVASPTGSWNLNIEQPVIAGLDLGSASTTIDLGEGRFTCADLVCNHGLQGSIFWNVHDAEVGGDLFWPQMPLSFLGEELMHLAGNTADVNLDFNVPFGQIPTIKLRAASDHAILDILGTPESVAVIADIQGALETSAVLARGADGRLSGDGSLKVTSASELLGLLAPEAGVPLTGTAQADFTVDWKDEPLPRIEGSLQSLDVELEKQPIRLIQPAEFTLSGDGFAVPGLLLGARDDELFVRWDIDADGQLRGNVSGTMDTLLLRFMLPDWEPAGRASGIIEILGTIDEPLFEGIAEIHKGSFRLPGTRTILSQVEGTVFLSSGDVQLEGMDFRFMGGRGRASGRIRERDDTIVLALDGTASGVRLEVLPKLDSRLSGNWRLMGPIDDLLLSGDITVDRLSLTSKEDIASLLLSWLEGTGSGTTGGGLNLSLRVEAEETIELRSPFVRLTGSASLDVTGTSNSPGLVGQVEILDGGEATFLGNRYEIERASLNFSDPTEIEPFIDLQAATWVQEYQITVRIAGSIDNFFTTATSTPPLSAPDIYSLLGAGTTGRGYGSGAVGLGLASSILSSELTSVLSRRSELALPVDQVRVDPFAADSTGNPTARLSLIKQITPAWTVILQTTLAGDREQVVISRWYLAPGFFIQASQQEDRSLSLDLKMRRPY